MNKHKLTHTIYILKTDLNFKEESASRLFNLSRCFFASPFILFGEMSKILEKRGGVKGRGRDVIGNSHVTLDHSFPPIRITICELDT